MNDSKVRVLIVDDSVLMRKLLGIILTSDSRIEIVGTAKDGVDGLAKVRALSPDVVTLDVDMPNKDGLEMLEEMMKTHPLPVIMVSSLTQEGAQVTLKALSLGCVDFVAKPSGTFSLDSRDVAADLIAKVIMAKSARLHSLPKVRGAETPKPAAPRRLGRREIVAVAASTGGPMALHQLMADLPGDFPVPIVITQHMPKEFTASFAKRLDSASELSVAEAAEGMQLRPGLAVVAPGGSHLIVKRRIPGGAFCGLSDAPPVLSVKPSANIMFSSVAEEFGGNVVGVILTGMGRDGTDGAAVLRSKGAYIIAESQETCVVYGMSKAAAEAGVVDELLPLTDIAEALVRCVKGV
ncbi:MAG: chemotaxis response regulator protein-glutamate methylesterase [Synergistaceae bacterium]|jgi:two-component system chemotaxis response regulator CheB|nr:chemotaxis response regulator protein-glutamate methylesterase [Synergistaceae bacterium]